MEIYTIGFTQKTAEQFFEPLKTHAIRSLWDTRIHTGSQLAGFARSDHLPYFLKQLCNAEYMPQPLLAPTPELLEAYRKKQITWNEYEQAFLDLMSERQIEHRFQPEMLNTATVLLCSEATPEHCHRRLVAEYLASHWSSLKIVHL